MDKFIISAGIKLKIDFDKNAKLEIYDEHKRWRESTPEVFRSWTGERKVNGKEYEGTIYFWLSNKIYESRIKMKDLIAEKISVETIRGKEYLKMDGSITSLPDVRNGEDEAVVFEDSSGMVRVFINHKGKPYLQTNKYDKDFPSLKALADYLNKQKMKYIGID